MTTRPSIHGALFALCLASGARAQTPPADPSTAATPVAALQPADPSATGGFVDLSGGLPANAFSATVPSLDPRRFKRRGPAQPAAPVEPRRVTDSPVESRQPDLPPVQDANLASPPPWQTLSNHEGFHIGLGVGVGTYVGIDEPGLLTQFKIGYGISDAVRIYYYALNHWYSQSYGLSDPNGFFIEGESELRIAAINGIGIDYFFLPRVGLRLALGLGGDVIFSRSKDAEFSDTAIGVAFAIGTTFELLGGDHQFTIDPVVNVVTFDTTKLSKEEFRAANASEWKSFPVFGVVLAYSYH